MPRTDNVTKKGVTYWMVYELPTQEPNGSWKAFASGRVRYCHDDGTTFTAETETKSAYGHTEAVASFGAKARVAKQLVRIVTFICLAREPESTV